MTQETLLRHLAAIQAQIMRNYSMTREKSIIVLSGEPYLEDDVKFKTDPDNYIWKEELSDWTNWIEDFNEDIS